MTDLKEPKKPSYVGPKKVNLTLRGVGTDTLKYTFPTSMAYHKAVQMIFTDPGEGIDPISIRDGVDRLDVVPRDVTALIWPKEELILRKSSKSYIVLDLFFETGMHSVAITGENRLRIAYKALEPLLGKKPNEKSPAIVINQEENKKAYIKHESVLMAMRSSEFMDDE